MFHASTMCSVAAPPDRSLQCVQLTPLDVEGEPLRGLEVFVADAQLIDLDHTFGRQVAAGAE